MNADDPHRVVWPTRDTPSARDTRPRPHEGNCEGCSERDADMQVAYPGVSDDRVTRWCFDCAGSGIALLSALGFRRACWEWRTAGRADAASLCKPRWDWTQNLKPMSYTTSIRHRF
jgi:hypothetical protein